MAAQSLTQQLDDRHSLTGRKFPYGNLVLAEFPSFFIVVITQIDARRVIATLFGTVEPHEVDDTPSRGGCLYGLVPYCRSMRKHPAAWLLAALITLGAPQAVPLARVQQKAQICAIVCVFEARRPQHVPRQRQTRGYVRPNPRSSCRYELPTVIRRFWNSRFARPPPFPALA